MKYAIIGSGKIGTALARKFAQKKVEVGIANSRGPETLASLREELGPEILPQSIQEATGAEIILLAVPFTAHKDVVKQLEVERQDFCRCYECITHRSQRTGRSAFL